MPVWLRWLVAAAVFLAALALSLVASITKHRHAPPVLTRLLTALSLTLAALSGVLFGQLVFGGAK